MSSHKCLCVVEKERQAAEVSIIRMLIPFTTGQGSYFLILSPSIGVLSCGCPRSVNIQPTVALLEHAWCFGHPALPSWSWRTLGSLDALFSHPGLCFQPPNVSPLCLAWVTPIPHLVCPLSSGMLFQDISPTTTTAHLAVLTQVKVIFS